MSYAYYGYNERILGKKNNSVIFYPSTNKYTKTYLAIGIVEQIKKGDDFDLMYVRCGYGKADIFIVKNEKARKQLIFVKANTFIMIYGYAKLFVDKFVFMCVCMWSSVVPNIQDIRTRNIDQEIFSVLNNDSKEYKDTKDFLSSFEKK